MTKTFCDLCETEIPTSEACRTITISGGGMTTAYAHVCRRCHADFLEWAKGRNVKCMPRRGEDDNGE